MRRFLRRWVCRYLGHWWRYPLNADQRVCRTCARVEWGGVRPVFYEP